MEISDEVKRRLYDNLSSQQIYLHEHPCTQGYTQECRDWAKSYTPPETLPCAVNDPYYKGSALKSPWIPFPTDPVFGNAKSVEGSAELFNDCRDFQFYKLHKMVQNMEPENQQADWDQKVGDFMNHGYYRKNGANFDPRWSLNKSMGTLIKNYGFTYNPDSNE